MKTSITAKQLADLGNVTIIDVRKKPAYDENPAVIADAQWRDPAAVDDWGAEFAGAALVVCYCVRDHEVSQDASAALRARGLDARYLEGGIDGWKETGGAVEPKANTKDQ
jgi:Fe-Mn family superoxide dismutase